jgi:hypothetical protein
MGEFSPNQVTLISAYLTLSKIGQNRWKKFRQIWWPTKHTRWLFLDLATCLRNYICRNSTYVKTSPSGLPDGFFSNQKSQFGYILEGLSLKNVDIFYGHLKYFTDIWDVLWPIGTFVFIWYIFSGFGITRQDKSGNPGHLAAKAWTTLAQRSRNSASKFGPRFVLLRSETFRMMASASEKGD